MSLIEDAGIAILESIWNSISEYVVILLGIIVIGILIYIFAKSW